MRPARTPSYPLVMRRQEDNAERSTAERSRPLVYLPCPACGSAVLLSDDARVTGEPPAYECALCGALFELRPP